MCKSLLHMHEMAYIPATAINQPFTTRCMRNTNTDDKPRLLSSGTPFLHRKMTCLIKMINVPVFVFAGAALARAEVTHLR